MPYVIILCLAIIVFLLIKNFFEKYFTNIASDLNKKKAKPTGDVIDISHSWIDVSDLQLIKREQLLLPKELALFNQFYNILFEHHFTIFPKVRLAEIFSLPTNTKNRNEFQLRLMERTADYLICETSTLKPKLLIFTNSQNDSKREKLAKEFGIRAAESVNMKYLNINLDQNNESTDLLELLKSVALIK